MCPKRNYYHGSDLVPCLKHIDHLLDQMPKRKNMKMAIEFTQCSYPNFKSDLLRKTYKLWVSHNKPDTYVYLDHRHQNQSTKAITNNGEHLIVDQIFERNQMHQQVTYRDIRQMAIKQWVTEDHVKNKEFQFVCCDGWILKFMKRHGLSSQLVSKHCLITSKKKRDVQEKEAMINKYLKEYQDFIEHNGSIHVYNFDETSFINSQGIRTVAPKRTRHKNKLLDLSTIKPCLDQPKIINQLSSNQRVTIGVIVSKNGQRLKPIINVKGITSRCLKKYQICSPSDYVLTYTKSSWFHQETMHNVLKLIHQQTGGQKALCIWDCYKPHQQISVIEMAQKLNIQLLTVPHGLTSLYQPLDYQFNGIFKQLMKSYWFGHRYNEDTSNICHHMIETVVNSYYTISQQSIISSFDCMKS